MIPEPGIRPALSCAVSSRRLVVSVATAALLGIVPVASAYQWSAPVVISETTTYNQDPRIFQGATGSAMAMWRTDPNPTNAVARSVGPGVASGPIVPLPKMLNGEIEAPAAGISADGALFSITTSGDGNSVEAVVGKLGPGALSATAFPVFGLPGAGDDLLTPAAFTAPSGITTSAFVAYEPSQPSGSRYRLVVSRVAADGQALIPAQAVVTTSLNSDTTPVIAGNARGDVVIAFWSGGNSRPIRAFTITADGTIGAVKELDNGAGQYTYYGVSAAMASDGLATVAWVDDASSTGNTSVRIARMPLGGDPDSSTILEDDVSDGTLTGVSVRSDGSGVVAWSNSVAGGAPVGVAAKTFDAAGTLGPRMQVSAEGAEPDDNGDNIPQVHAGLNGTSTFVWAGCLTNAQSCTTQILSRQFSGTQPEGGVQQVSGLPTSQAYGYVYPQPRLTHSPDGTALVVFQQYYYQGAPSPIAISYGSVPPLAIAPPSITSGGEPPTVGSPVVGNPGTWHGTNATRVNQWLACASSSTATGCSPITGANGTSYTPVSGDIGKYLRLQVTASNDLQSGVESSSSAVGPVVAAPSPSNTVPKSLKVTVPPRLARAGLPVSRNGVVRLPLSCPSGIPGNCDADGLLSMTLPGSVTAQRKSANASRVRVLAQFRGVEIQSGTTRLYAVRLKPSLYNALRRAGVRRVPATLRTANRLSGTGEVRSTQRVWLRILPLRVPVTG